MVELEVHMAGPQKNKQMVQVSDPEDEDISMEDATMSNSQSPVKMLTNDTFLSEQMTEQPLSQPQGSIVF